MLRREWKRERMVRMHLKFSTDQIAEVLGRRCRAGKRTREDADDATRRLELRYFREMLEGRCPVTIAIGKCRPELHTIQPAGVVIRRSLRMRNGAPRRHAFPPPGPKTRSLLQPAVCTVPAVNHPGTGRRPVVRCRR